MSDSRADTGAREPQWSFVYAKTGKRVLCADEIQAHQLERLAAGHVEWRSPWLAAGVGVPPDEAEQPLEAHSAESAETRGGTPMADTKALLPVVSRLRVFAQQKASPMVADILNEAADALEQARKERDQAQRALADCVRTRDTGGKLYG